MYKSHAGMDALQGRVFAYLREARATNGTNVAFVDLHRCVARRANAHLERVFCGSGGPSRAPGSTLTCASWTFLHGARIVIVDRRSSGFDIELRSVKTVRRDPRRPGCVRVRRGGERNVFVECDK